MTEILNHFEPITLDQMKDIRLMNRIDTKFVTTGPVLRRLLEMAADDYFVQEEDTYPLIRQCRTEFPGGEDEEQPRPHEEEACHYGAVRRSSSAARY